MQPSDNQHINNAANAEVQQELRRIIAAAYELFAPYKLGTSLAVCKACCVTDAEEQALLTTPLRETPSDMLWRGYYESACYHTERELWEMKHFLPRVLELVSQFDYPCHSTEITFLRLDLDQPAGWLPTERALLAEFALAFIEHCLQTCPLPDGDDLDAVLVMFGLAHFDLLPLLHQWQRSSAPASLQHFARLLGRDVKLPPHGPLGFGDPFSEPFVDAQLATWLGDPAVRAAWATRLESAVLHGQLPAEQAALASAAYEVLTVELT